MALCKTGKQRVRLCSCSFPAPSPSSGHILCFYAFPSSILLLLPLLSGVNFLLSRASVPLHLALHPNCALSLSGSPESLQGRAGSRGSLWIANSTVSWSAPREGVLHRRPTWAVCTSVGMHPTRYPDSKRLGLSYSCVQLNQCWTTETHPHATCASLWVSGTGARNK